MKKTIIIVLTICIIFTSLVACNSSNLNNNEQLQGNASLPNVTIDSPPAYRSYTFNSYQEIEKALTHKNSTLREEQKEYGAIYQNMLSEFKSSDIELVVPTTNGKTIPFQNKEGFANITLLTSELYNLPWLWYHCVIEDQNVDITISYLQSIQNFKTYSNTTYTDVLKSIAPDAPSPENYNEYEAYKNIYEKKIVLKDDVTVTAMISELSYGSNVYVMFHHDGMLISIYGDNSLFTDAFWQTFSLEPYKRIK